MPKRDIAMAVFALLGVVALLFIPEFGLWAGGFGFSCSIVAAILTVWKRKGENHG